MVWASSTSLKTESSVSSLKGKEGQLERMTVCESVRLLRSGLKVRGIYENPAAAILIGD